ncbi:3383_t:CDS:2 [Diversispora eburnea]|uniref:3383_t:CDS:1 n=1 Tax=Diversispora eburnea TaxID=1213867 RepID=A0A9N8YV48_9GLOM|nr:3383_t:CDS:2 [Diversispora eburnea]
MVNENMDEEQWAILFDKDYIRAEDYKRNLQTLNGYNQFLEEIPSLLKLEISNELSQCSRCQKISQLLHNDDDMSCQIFKYFHEMKRITSVADLRDAKVDIEMLERLFKMYIYICQNCDKMSTVPEHSGYHNHSYLNSFVHPFFPTQKNSLRHPNSYVLTNLNQLKGIEIDLLDFMDILKECVNFIRPITIPVKWDIYIEEIHLGKRNLYNGIFENNEWKRYIKIDDEFNYLPIMPHQPNRIDKADIFINSKVSLNCLGEIFARRNDVKSYSLNKFLHDVLGFSYFVKHCEIFICIRCGSFSLLKQGDGKLCRKPYLNHLFQRITDVYQFYDEQINLFEFQYVMKSALDISYPDKPIHSIHMKNIKSNGLLNRHI